MYESPVKVIYGEMQMQVKGDIYKAIQNVGVDVNKEELIKALQYDRNQYSRGYADAIDEFIKQVNRLCFGLKASQGNITRVDVVQNALHQIAEELKGGENK